MIEWKTVLIGSVLAIILNFVLSFVPFGGLAGYLVAIIYVGYTVGGGYQNGAKHGAIVGVIEGIVAVIEIGFFARGNQIAIFGSGNFDIFIFVLLTAIMLFGIMGVIGGIVGAFIKGSRSPRENTA